MFDVMVMRLAFLESMICNSRRLVAFSRSSAVQRNARMFDLAGISGARSAKLEKTIQCTDILRQNVIEL